MKNEAKKLYSFAGSILQCPLLAILVFKKSTEGELRIPVKDTDAMHWTFMTFMFIDPPAIFST